MTNPELSRLERLGVSLLHAAPAASPAHAAPPQSADDTSEINAGGSIAPSQVGPSPVGLSHIALLNEQEQETLRRIERRAVWRAGLAGAVSAGVAVAAMVWWRDIEQTQPWRYWAWVLGAGALAAVLEIAFLYWDALRSVRQMARAAGLRLINGQDPDDFVVVALARAALELPSPKRNELRVDPLRETSRAMLFLASVVYKSKIAVSSFLLKALLRRALGRLAARVALELVAVPVTALWNMYVCRKVLREARLRVMGPSLATTLAEWVQAPLPQNAREPSQSPAEGSSASSASDGESQVNAASNGSAGNGGNGGRVTRAGLKGQRMAARQDHVRSVEQQPKAADAPSVSPRTLALWAVGTAFVKNRKVHPNVQALVRALGPNGQVKDSPDFGDCPRFLRALKATAGPARSAALRALVASSILDGKLTRIEREWLDVVFTVVGQQVPVEALKQACARFVRGEGFEPADFPNL